MYILPQERPQNVGYTNKVIEVGERIYPLENVPICIKCKHSKPNMSYTKDEMDCVETGGICNALCTCDRWQEDY